MTGGFGPLGYGLSVRLTTLPCKKHCSESINQASAQSQWETKLKTEKGQHGIKDWKIKYQNFVKARRFENIN